MTGTLTIGGTAGNSTTIGYELTTTDGTSATWVTWPGANIYPPNDSWKSGYIQREEVKDMRGLFNIYVVDYKNDQVIVDGYVIAGDEAKAKMKALQKWNTVMAGYDLDDLDIICVKLGNVRKKREVQKVEIVESE